MQLSNFIFFILISLPPKINRFLNFSSNYILRLKIICYFFFFGLNFKHSFSFVFVFLWRHRKIVPEILYFRKMYCLSFVAFNGKKDWLGWLAANTNQWCSICFEANVCALFFCTENQFWNSKNDDAFCSSIAISSCFRLDTCIICDSFCFIRFVSCKILYISKS